MGATSKYGASIASMAVETERLRAQRKVLVHDTHLSRYNGVLADLNCLNILDPKAVIDDSTISTNYDPSESESLLIPDLPGYQQPVILDADGGIAMNDYSGSNFYDGDLEASPLLNVENMLESYKAHASSLRINSRIVQAFGRRLLPNYRHQDQVNLFKNDQYLVIFKIIFRRCAFALIETLTTTNVDVSFVYRH